MDTCCDLLPLTTPQATFRQSDAWIRGFVAGRGAGKTKIGAIDIVLRAKAEEPYMCVSPSYKVLEDTTLPVFLETVRDLDALVLSRKTPVPRVHFRCQNGGVANIIFRSGEDPESLRGPSKAGLWIDEASIQAHEVFLLGIPVLRHRGKMGFCSLTFTPKGKRHWTYEVFYSRDRSGNWLPKDNTSLVQAHTLDNPFLPPEYHDNIRSTYTQLMARQELGGEFVDIIGLMFDRSSFGFADEPPAGARRVRYWDAAATVGSGSYTAGVLMSRTDAGVFMVEDVVRGQWSAQERNKIMLQTAEDDAQRYNNNVRVYVEQEGGSGGKEAVEQIIRLLARFPVYKDILTGRRVQTKDHIKVPGQAKITRAGPLSAQTEAGNVRILSGAPWVRDYIDELCQFPESAHSDQVDASSGAFNKLAALAKMAMDTPRGVQRSREAIEYPGIRVVKPGARNGRRQPRTAGARG